MDRAKIPKSCCPGGQGLAGGLRVRNGALLDGGEAVSPPTLSFCGCSVGMGHYQMEGQSLVAIRGESEQHPRTHTHSPILWRQFLISGGFLFSGNSSVLN